MAKNKGGSYSPPTRAEIEAMRAEKMQLVPNGEAGRRERKLLEHYSAAQADLQWIVDNNAWHELGFDTFTGWYAARVRPAVAAAGLRPTQEFALYVLENVQSDEAGLPKQQRLLQRELADLVGVSVSTLRRLSQDPSQTSNGAGADLEHADDPDPADIPAAVTQLLTEAAAASVGAGVTMSAARPAESPCSDAPDRAHCAAASCGAELPGNEQAAGHLRCRSCDPLTLHKAEGLGFEEGYGECDECAIQARIAERTSAASVAAANTDSSPLAVGEPDVDEQAASTSGTPSSEENFSDGEDAQPRVAPVGSEPGYDGLGSGELEERTDEVAAHEQVSGWGGVVGECGVSCACGVTFDGFDTIAEAAELLDRHIANPEERNEEEAASLTSEDSPAADLIEPSHAGVPAVGVQDPPTGREGGRSETDFPVGPDHPVATAVLPGLDHHRAGVSGGEAPEGRDLSRLPVGELEDGGQPALTPSSSDSDHWAIDDGWSAVYDAFDGSDRRHLIGFFDNIDALCDRLDVDVVGPLLTEDEMVHIHKAGDRLAQVAELLEHWRTK